MPADLLSEDPDSGRVVVVATDITEIRQQRDQTTAAPAFAIETPVCEADLLYPPVGRPKTEIRHRAVTAPSDGRPLDLAGPRHPAYSGEVR